MTQEELTQILACGLLDSEILTDIILKKLPIKLHKEFLEVVELNKQIKENQKNFSPKIWINTK